MSTEQELLSQLEELRKKQKDMEEQNKDVEFNKQRNFLIKTVRDFLGIEVSDAEVLSILLNRSGGHITVQYTPILYYTKKEDENMLFERQVYNRYARYYEIRYEDSFDIIRNFIGKIKPLNDYIEWQKENQTRMHNQGYLSKRRSASPKGDKIHEKIINEYIPLFC